MAMPKGLWKRFMSIGSVQASAIYPRAFNSIETQLHVKEKGEHIPVDSEVLAASSALSQYAAHGVFLLILDNHGLEFAL